MISVTLAKPDASLDAHWDALRPFAHNVFLHPAALRAASETMIAVITVLLAWDMSVEPNKLVGLWAVQGKQLFLWPFLETLPFNYSFLSTPVLHPDYAEEAMPAFLAAIAHERSLPKTLVFRDLDAAGREHSAITQATAGHPQLELRADQRPIATREAGLKRSGSTRKKLRQDWNKLGAAGTVEVVNVREASAIGEAFESFLEMEQKSWKGAGGTALLSNPNDATFARRFIDDMAARGEASVALLKLDGKPIAAQVLLYGNRIAYTWKTSFDPDLARYSPGTLLVDKISIDLIDGGEIDAFDSCARGDSFMAQLWSGRKPMVDFITTASPRQSAGYVAISSYFRAREGLKALRDGMRQKPKPAATAPAATQPAAASPAPAQPAASGQKSKADRAA
jgi:CelD/BcsL family acetyltransferase involved in cellulose biosynthesis